MGKNVSVLALAVCYSFAKKPPIAGQVDIRHKHGVVVMM